MVIGNSTEFWLFTYQPYGGLNARNFAWMTVLLGALILLIGTFILGICWLRSHQLSFWASVAFTLALPLTIAGIFLGFMFLPLAPLTWIMSGFVLYPKLADIRVFRKIGCLHPRNKRLPAQEHPFRRIGRFRLRQPDHAD